MVRGSRGRHGNLRALAFSIRSALCSAAMNPLPKRILLSSGALLFLLLLVTNLWLRPNQALQMSPTSFGIMRDGYQAAFDLLSEMHLPVTRSFHRPKLMPTNQTAWFVAPSFLIADKP